MDSIIEDAFHITFFGTQPTLTQVPDEELEKCH